MWIIENKKLVLTPVEVDGEVIFVPEQTEEMFPKEIKARRYARGRVRWFKRSLGYGFIQEDGNVEEIFVHQSSVQVPGIKVLRDGQRVLFEKCDLSRGHMALNVIPIVEKPETLAKYAQKG